jgi:hypothetical protein
MRCFALSATIVALVTLAASRSIVAAEADDAASLERLRSEIARRLPAGWTVRIEPAGPVRTRGPGTEVLAVVIASNEKLPVELHAPNPAAGQAPKMEMEKAQIVLAVCPFLTQEQYQQLRAKDEQLVASRTAVEQRLKKQIKWGYMGGDPVPPSAFDPKDDAQRRSVLEYALLWNHTEPEPLPTHYFESVAFEEKPSLYTIADRTKAKEYTDIVKALDELLKPYEKPAR